MKKLLFIASLLLIMVGCNNPIKKPITKELTIEEIKSIRNKEPEFLNFYEKFFDNESYKHFLTDKVAQVEYGELTYKKLYEYYQQINDDEWLKNVDNEGVIIWKEKYIGDECKFDSIIDYWENYIDEYKNIIDISFGCYLEGNVFFNVTPKNHEIYGFVFYYNLVLKETQEIIIEKEKVDYNWIKFSGPNIIDSRVSNPNLIRLKSKVEKGNKDWLPGKTCEFQYKIISLQGDSITIPPYIIMRYFEQKYLNDSINSMEMSIEACKEMIIKEYINNDYISLIKFREDYCSIQEKELNPLCYNYIEYLNHE